MATSFNVWFHIDDPTTVVDIGKLSGTEREGNIVTDIITIVDPDLYRCVFPTNQPEYREEAIMVPVMSGSPPVPVISGGMPIMEPSGETYNHVWVPDDAYVELDDGVDPIALDLQQAKIEQKVLIKQGFINSPTSGLTVTMASSGSPSNVKIDCYRDNQDDFRQAYEKALRDGATEVVIRDYNNEYQTIATVDCETIYIAIQEFGIEQYDKKWAKETSIDACTTIEEVQAITWDSVES